MMGIVENEGDFEKERRMAEVIRCSLFVFLVFQRYD
jgi:hypothetical protein